MEIKQKTLERLVVLDGKVLDSKGNIVDAEPVTNLKLLILYGEAQGRLYEEINKGAPENVDSYMLSEPTTRIHSGTVGDNANYITIEDVLLGHVKQKINYHYSSVYGLQYWKKK